MRRLIQLVSIPKRVSAKVEPLVRFSQALINLVSIPKRVSAKVELAQLPAPNVVSSEFQSLKGFQPKWNRLLPAVLGLGISFQSLKGFQPKWNRPVHAQTAIADVFQSLKGFQPKWNYHMNFNVFQKLRVSIPKRVSAKVELTALD